MNVHTLAGAPSRYFNLKYRDRVVVVYDDLEELLNVGTIVTPSKANEAARASVATSRSSGVSTKQIATLIREGWPQGGQVAAVVSDHIRESAPQPKDLRRKLGWSDHGDELDMTRVYRGDLDRAWKRARRQYGVTQQSFRIAFHWCDYASDWRSMIYNGITAIALADLLERYGYRCEIIGIHTGGVFPNGQLKQAWQAISVLPVKGYDEPVRVDALAAIAHPGTFKHLGIQGYHGLDRPCPQGGRCDDAASKVATELTRLGLLERCDVVFDFCGGADGCRYEVEKALRQLNGEHFLLQEGDFKPVRGDDGSLYEKLSALGAW